MAALAFDGSPTTASARKLNNLAEGGRPRAQEVVRLICTSSAGDTAEIVAVVKTQGSDTKLVGQMQPY